MFNFFAKDKDIRLRDDVILEMLIMILKHVEEVGKMRIDNEISNETFALASKSVGSLGELESLKEYLSNSDDSTLRVISRKFETISKTLREETFKDKDGK